MPVWWPRHFPELSKIVAWAIPSGWSGTRKLILTADDNRFVEGMLVGRMNPLAVRVHVGVEEKRHKRRENRSSPSNESNEIADEFEN